jgi:N-acetylmuramoyl-L-alanine amidase
METYVRRRLGHDENTPGKGVAGMKEFEFNKAVVLEMDKLLKEYENVETQFSHNLFDGIDDSLTTRTNRANEWGAHCFASVHGNAAASTSANGIETFTHPNAPANTINLAAEVQGELIRATGLNNRGLKKADFQVLRQTKMDSFLAECGFMTNAGDLAKLKSDDFRKKCAQAIVNGIVKHYKLVKKAEQRKAGVNVNYTDKVTVPNTAFWQAALLVQEYQKRGFKCYMIPTNQFKEQDKDDPAPFVVETDFTRANLVKMELVNKGYTKTTWEAL